MVNVFDLIQEAEKHIVQAYRSLEASGTETVNTDLQRLTSELATLNKSLREKKRNLLSSILSMLKVIQMDREPFIANVTGYTIRFHPSAKYPLEFIREGRSGSVWRDLDAFELVPQFKAVFWDFCAQAVDSIEQHLTRGNTLVSDALRLEELAVRVGELLIPQTNN